MPGGQEEATTAPRPHFGSPDGSHRSAMAPKNSQLTGSEEKCTDMAHDGVQPANVPDPPMRT